MSGMTLQNQTKPPASAFHLCSGKKLPWRHCRPLSSEGTVTGFKQPGGQEGAVSRRQL